MADNETQQAKNEDRRSGPRVLIIRPSAMGDVSRTVPALVTLRRAMPDAWIEWLVGDAYQSIIRHHPALDGVVSFPREDLGGLARSTGAARRAIRWARELRGRNYDLVIDLQGLFRSGLMSRITGAATRVGYANAREFGWLGYNRRHKIDASMHAVDRMLALLEAEGQEPVRDMTLYVGAEDQQWLEAWKKQSRIGEGSYVCLAPAARWQSKRWPIINYIELTHKLIDAGLAGDRVVILASGDELKIIKPLLDDLGRTAPLVFPRTSVGQMMALISGAKLVIGNDTAAMHVAVGLDRPVVGIYGPTDPAVVGPYGREDSVVRPPDIESVNLAKYRRRRNDQTLIGQISVEAVWEVVRSQLGAPDEGGRTQRVDTDADERSITDDAEATPNRSAIDADAGGQIDRLDQGLASDAEPQEARKAG